MKMKEMLDGVDKEGVQICFVRRDVVKDAHVLANMIRNGGYGHDGVPSQEFSQ
jgi:hypothetical protein